MLWEGSGGASLSASERERQQHLEEELSRMREVMAEEKARNAQEVLRLKAHHQVR